MKHRNMPRSLLAWATALMIAAAASPVSAETVTGTGSVGRVIPMEGTISPLILCVTHPVSIAWSIDPNSAVPFSAPDFAITNNSTARIVVNVKSFEAAAQPILGDPAEILLEDVGAGSKNWPLLNAADSMRYIALGISPFVQSGWDIGARDSVAYAADIGDTFMGRLSAGQSGVLGLSALHGFAITRSFVAAHTLVLSFALD